jgi:hypothetical protein
VLVKDKEKTMTTLQKVANGIPNLYKQIKNKICDDNRFCEDVMMMGLCFSVFYIMWISIAQIGTF